MKLDIRLGVESGLKSRPGILSKAQEYLHPGTSSVDYTVL